MKICVITLCYNEEVILPFFIRHYEQVADRIICYDGGSTDRTREIIAACPIAELRELNTGGQVDDGRMFESRTRPTATLMPTGSTADHGRPAGPRAVEHPRRALLGAPVSFTGPLEGRQWRPTPCAAAGLSFGSPSSRCDSSARPEVLSAYDPSAAEWESAREYIGIVRWRSRRPTKGGSWLS